MVSEPTGRDFVWAAALKRLDADNVVTANRVYEQIDYALDDPPSRQTVRNVLKAMVAIGVLEEQSARNSATNIYTQSESVSEWDNF